MDNELKAKWTAALRSGEFVQGRDALHKDGAYCCLGVLCKVAGADMSGEIKNAAADEDEEGGEIKPTAFIDESHYTEEDELGGLLDYFGIGSRVESTLIKLNDTDGENFNGIADWIDAHDLKTGKPLATESGE